MLIRISIIFDPCNLHNSVKIDNASKLFKVWGKRVNHHLHVTAVEPISNTIRSGSLWLNALSKRFLEFICHVLFWGFSLRLHSLSIQLFMCFTTGTEKTFLFFILMSPCSDASDVAGMFIVIASEVRIS